MLLLLQTPGPPQWVGPTMAVSLVVIALAFAVIAAAAAMTARRGAIELQRLAHTIDALRTDLSPALRAVQAVSAEGERLATMVGDEVEAMVGSSRAVREHLRRRLSDLEAVYEVLEEEVEETALDLATTLRTLRRGHGWYARLLRWLGVRRRGR